MSDDKTKPCHERAMEGEPMFTLLARDPQAPGLIRQWADTRIQRLRLNRDMQLHTEATLQDNKEEIEYAQQAHAVADAMEAWRTAHDGEWRDAPKA